MKIFSSPKKNENNNTISRSFFQPKDPNNYFFKSDSQNAKNNSSTAVPFFNTTTIQKKGNKNLLKKISKHKKTAITNNQIQTNYNHDDTRRGSQSDPGDCTIGQHRRLQNNVNEKCKSKRGCKGTDSCAELLEKQAKNSQCINARVTINNTCFKGGDAGHNDAVRQATNALIICQKFYTKKCKRDKPENVPNPVTVPVPESTWNRIRHFVHEVAKSGVDHEKAAEQFLRENPTIAWSIIAIGVVGIIALIADDLTVAGIADDVLIPIVGTLIRVAWRFT